MVAKISNNNQGSLFYDNLINIINKKHSLVLLADKIDWKYFENEFSKYYSRRGRPAMPIRFMVGCMILKHLYNVGDEKLVEMWVENPYMQYFCGMEKFQHEFPCDPSDFVHFRKRIGEEGMEKIFLYSIKINEIKESKEGQVVLSDTTVQGNNVTYPTDAKLYKKVIDKAREIAKKEGIEQRQSYVRVSKELLQKSNRSRKGKKDKEAKKAERKLRTIGGRVVRELEKKMNEEQKERWKEEMEIMNRVINQEKDSKGKVYSLHKPYTSCIAKGKMSSPYEFGNKVGLVVDRDSKVVIAVKGFMGNVHDSQTIEPLLKWIKEKTEIKVKEVVYDRGGGKAREIEGVKVEVPRVLGEGASEKEKREVREKFRKRAGIEGIISHLKKEYRMQENYYNCLKEKSVNVNAYLCAAAWNFKKWMEKAIRFIFVFIFGVEIEVIKARIFSKNKLSRTIVNF
jgi:IS5 family transposase